MTQARYQRWRKRVPACAAVAVAVVATASAAAGAQGVTERLSVALKKLPDGRASAGACVIDPERGETVFAFRADEPMTPASAGKIFVMSAAIAALGPGFSFETVLAEQGADLVVIGAGDPGFGDPELARTRGESVTAPLERWAETLRARGRAAATGRFVVDDFIFDDQPVHPTWEAADLGRWYAAPVGGLCLNDNCVEITLHPGDRPGAKPTWSVTPPLRDTIRLINECKTGKGPTPLLHVDATARGYRVTGAVSKPHTFESVATFDPTLTFVDAMRTVLARGGVAPTGDVVRRPVRRPDGSLPPDARLLAMHRTALSEVLSRIGRNSQNLFAECLMKRLGYEWQRRQGWTTPRGSWESGSAAIGEALREGGVSTGGLTVVDGSGLSRANRCTARHLAETLAWMSRHPQGRVLAESLARPGEPGSLRTTMKDLAGRVRAKTGTMRGVRALAGYVTSASGKEYAFAVMFNDYAGSSSPYKAIEHQFCKILAAELP